MVKVGFIVEGACEKIVIESEAFKNFLHRNGFELVEPVVDAKGAGNLLPHNIEPFIGVLEAKRAERLYILTDSDGRPVEDVKERISHAKITAYFIAVKAIEAWFLADTQAMRKFLDIRDFTGEDFPEETPELPWERIKEIVEETGSVKRRGKYKVAFTKKMITDWEFSIENAATHPNCPSAKNFVEYFQSNQ
ncbi:hypothetical protein DPV96_06505 [Aggregatibacter segnis]|uniref:hypothetical protein n=1 Tax=Aggregatibacter segnis TaxID=739 RepID=UPI000DAE4F50|nr:hypothetical protein [Aggregatibacter segnis]RDE66900.1 hypothetical protein DPV96_06505 [Aggregatibacter segnis]